MYYMQKIKIYKYKNIFIFLFFILFEISNTLKVDDK